MGVLSCLPLHTDIHYEPHCGGCDDTQRMCKRMSIYGVEDSSLGFSVGEASFSGSIYGKVFTIGDYLSDTEMERIADMVSTEAQQSDIYPVMSIWENMVYDTAFEKTRILWDNWDTICRWTDDADLAHISGHHDIRYNNTYGERPEYIRERLQVSPADMKLYPPHTDCGVKALTILVPIAPGVSEPTRFHGYMAGKTIRSIPWEINQAYMFRPSHEHSYHSYVGGPKDRYVMNINFMFAYS